MHRIFIHLMDYQPSESKQIFGISTLKEFSLGLLWKSVQIYSWYQSKCHFQYLDKGLINAGVYLILDFLVASRTLSSITVKIPSAFIVTIEKVVPRSNLGYVIGGELFPDIVNINDLTS